MNNSKINTLIDELKEAIQLTYSGFKGIYFFGSRNNDTWNEDSDVDILLAFDRDLSWQEKRSIKSDIYDIELKYDYLIDAKIYKQSDIDNPITPFREQVKNTSVFYAV
jgi:predicted nucleotidyltransferase